MNELLRYEEVIKEQLSDLPLPDENFAWTEMKKLLEKGDDDRVILLPWKRGCGPLALLLLLLFGFAWYFLHPEKWFISESKKTNTTVQTVPENKVKKQAEIPLNSFGDTVTYLTKENNQVDTASIKGKRVTSERTNNLINSEDTLSTGKKLVVRNEKELFNQPPNEQLKESIPSKGISLNKKQKSNPRHLPPRGRPGGGPIKEKTNSNKANERIDANSHINTRADFPNKDSLPVPAIISTNKSDTLTDSLPLKKPIALNKIDSTIKKDSTKTNEPKKNTYSWGAGLGLNQQIPFDGQTAVPYNSLGRKGSLTDYIPSLYGRFYKDDKWFIQAEIRYGAPQYSKNTVYSSQKNANNTETNLALKKTYYHQLPVGFNYYLLPGLTVGSGFVWNKFSSAVVEQKIQRPSVPGQPDSIFNTSVFRIRNNDSSDVFSKSFFQWMTEIQYSYKKKYTLGARYARGIQPYIRFQLPNEPVKEERNSSLQLFFQYEFWKKKQKPKK